MVFGLVAAFFWGTHSVIVRYLTSDLHGITIAVLRLYIAALVLYGIMKLKSHPVSIRLSDPNLLLTVFGTAANYVLFHIGLEHTSASNAMLLENTAPFFIVIFLLLMPGERVGWFEVIATLIALAGVYFTVRQDLDVGGEGLQGDFLEIFAGLTWAIFILGSSRALRQTQSALERVGFLFNVFILSALILTPFMFLYPIQATANDVLFLILLGVFPTAVAYYLWYEAASQVSTVSAALLFTLSVVFTLVNAHLFLGEALTSNMIIGAALIVSGTVLSKFSPRNK